MDEKNLINYYNKFNEDKRLNSRHGKLEFITSMKYIHEYLNNYSNPKIIDIGAGTGKYSVSLAEEGYDVTALELVKHNLRVIEKKNTLVHSYLGNALDLSKFSDESFDLTLLFGPMYHLISFEDKVKALKEAKRVTSKNGIIMVAYCMNDYAVIKHGFMEKSIKEDFKNNLINNNFHVTPDKTSLYSYLNLDDINKLNDEVGLERIKIISPDGCANYLRSYINKLDDEEFELFVQYHLKNCERQDLIGAGAHTLDILKKS